MPLSTAAFVVSAAASVSAANVVANSTGHQHYKNQPQNFEIFDVGHRLIPQINVPDAFLSVYSMVWIPFLFMMPSQAETKTLLLRMGSIYVAMMLLRAVTTLVTILPSSNASCDGSVSWFTLIDGGCYDKIFSGHSLAAGLVSLGLVSSKVWSPLTGAAYSIGMALLLLITRGHFTVDILLGFSMAYLGWKCKDV